MPNPVSINWTFYRISQPYSYCEISSWLQVDCSTSLGISTRSLLTDMNSPIGNMTGNALEVAESLQCLKGQGPPDLDDLVVNLGKAVLFLLAILRPRKLIFPSIFLSLYPSIHPSIHLSTYLSFSLSISLFIYLPT